MSTEIRSENPDDKRIRLAGYSDGGTYVEITGGDHIGILRAEFLAAVETECEVRMVAADAIVIERAELPEVAAHPVPGAVVIDGGEYSLDIAVAAARDRALAFLALAEYLDAHPPMPPVSDEDVETLAGLITGGMTTPGAWTVARRLLDTGRVSVTR